MEDEATRLLKNADGVDITDSMLLNRLQQLRDVESMSAEEIVSADKVAYIDLSARPPIVRISGLWVGRDLALAQSVLRRAYRINRGVLKAKGVGKTVAPEAVEPPKPKKKRKKALRGKKLMDLQHQANAAGMTLSEFLEQKDARKAALKQMQKDAQSDYLAQVEQGIDPTTLDVADEPTGEPKKGVV